MQANVLKFKNQKNWSIQAMVLITLLLVSAGKVQAQINFRSVDNPPNYLWSDPNSWDQGAVPGSTDNVTIRRGHTIVANASDDCNRITMAGDANLTIDASATITTATTMKVQLNNDSETSTVNVNGKLVIGTNLVAKHKTAINTTINFTGTGSVVISKNFNITSDSTNHTVNIELPMSVTNKVSLITNGTDGELTVNLKDSLNAATLGLQASLNSQDSKNQLDMRYASAVLNLSNKFQFKNNGGYLLNSASIASDVILTTFARISTDPRINYHDLFLTTSSSVNSDTDINNVLGKLIINSGNTLSTNKKTLRISTGNLEVNGAITSGNNAGDSLILSGSEAQTITGSGLITVENLTIDNASGVSNSATINVNRFLHIDNGTFSTGGKVTLKSTSTRTAYLAEIGNNGAGAAISGSLACERNIDGVTNVGWRNLSTPVQGTTLQDWMHGVSPEGFWLYGFTGSNTPGVTGNSCYQYDPAPANLSGNNDDGWLAASNVSNAVTPHEPWTVYIGGSSGQGAKQNYDLSVSGTPYTGTITMNSTNANIAANASGNQTWGFIGNPYASAIAWSNVTSNNVNGTAQIYGLNDFNGYRATNFNASSDRIPPFQGFWVQTTGSSPSVTFNENDKITNNIDLRKSVQYDERFYFYLKDTAGEYNVGATIELNDLASEGYDNGLDGLIFENPWPLPNLYMMVDDSLITQVNSLNMNESREIDIYAYAVSGKEDRYHLDFTDFPNKPVCAYLKDLLLDSIIPIQQVSSYTFDLNADGSKPRFRLFVNAGPEEPTATHLSCFESGDGVLSFHLDSNTFAPTLLWNNQTPVILSHSQGVWTATRLTAGNYTLHATQHDNYCPTITQHSTLFEPQEVEAKLVLDNAEIEVGEALSFSNESKGAIEYYWNFGIDPWYVSQLPSEVSYSTPGEYVVSLVASNGNSACDDTLRSSLKVVAPILGQSEHQAVQKSLTWIFEKSGEYYLHIAPELSSEKVEWSLLAVDGKELYKSGKTQQEWEKEYLIPTRNLSSGMYLLRISSSNKHTDHRMLIR
ncbi:PKD domain-containing protein [bacterium SCSIO 12741]|nr:PKD domain-containing protein [bacterium SCSIO 12741]